MITDQSISTVYAEFGGKSTDSISIKFDYADTSATKTFNILLKQIPCGVNYKWVPTIINDKCEYLCVYMTGSQYKG